VALGQILIDEGTATKILTFVVDTDKHMEVMRLGGALNTDLQEINKAGAAFCIGGVPTQKSFRVNYTAAQTNTKIITTTTTKLAIVRLTVRVSRKVSVDLDIRVGIHATTTPTGDQCLLAVSDATGGDVIKEGDGAGLLGIAGAAGDDLLITTSGASTGGSLDVLVGYWEWTP